jgi:hypothetical protein
MAWEVSGDNPRVLQLKIILAQVTDGTEKSTELSEVQLQTVQLSPTDADATYQKIAAEASVDVHIALVSR